MISLDNNARLTLTVYSQAFTTIMRVAYGLDNAAENKELLGMFTVALKRVVDEGAPGATMIDLFPLRESRQISFLTGWLTVNQ